MLNKYLGRLQRLISEYRDAALEQFVGPGDKKAEFDDLCWYHLDPNTGRRTRLLCCRHGRKGKGDSIPPEFALPYPYGHLLKVWAIQVVNKPLSASEKRRQIAEARKVLSCIKGDLYLQTEESISLIYEGRIMYATPFMRFCIENGLMPRVNWLPTLDSRDRTGHSEFDKKQSKLPDIQAVIAIAQIFTRIFEPVNICGSVMPGGKVDMLDAIVATSAALSLASFNRMAAEIPVLSKQRLHSHSENGGEPVYYLDWKGSKGYKDNKNHILAALAGKIGKALNFFHDACEPARALCRFYENPNQSLKELLGGLIVAPERQRHLSLTARPNLFQLGYALGFYGVDDCVSVLKEGADPAAMYHVIRGKCFEKKPIYSLLSADQISTSISPVTQTSYGSMHVLFRLNMQRNPFGEKLTVTVAEAQKWWISHFRTTIIPEFPLSHTNSENNIRLKDAMFCVLGSSFYGVAGHGTGGKLFQKSHYAVVPLSSLASNITSRLRGNNWRSTIFRDYGYSSNLRLKPHSLRHFGNTLTDMSEIPVEINTALSGRVDPEQTHSYIHTSHSEKADRVGAVINRANMADQVIRVVSAKQLEQATNLPASLTSTGLCTQDLTVTPCDFLNDFVAQCFMCPETCHIAGDESAIAFLQKDFSYQNARLESVGCDRRLENSQAMKQWYVIHSRNTHFLSMLIDLMKKSPRGNIIRYSISKNEFHLTDLPTKTTTTVACVLPDSEGRLKRLLDQKTANAVPSVNPQLNALLLSFGLAGKES